MHLGKFKISSSVSSKLPLTLIVFAISKISVAYIIAERHAALSYRFENV